MQMGHLGQGDTGNRFMLYAEKGRRVRCPPGTTQESSGRMGTGQQYVQCWRPPAFAPPATTRITYEAPRTTVSPVIQAQVSPQISPVLTQAQASPGAAFQASPTQTQPGGQTAAGGGGMTAADVSRMLAEQRQADETRRVREMQALQQTMVERQNLLDRMAAQDAAAREQQTADRSQAEADAVQRAMDSAAALPPTAGAFVPPSPLQPPIAMEETALAFDAGDVVVPEETPAVPYLLLAVAAIGAAFVLRPKGAAKR